MPLYQGLNRELPEERHAFRELRYSSARKRTGGFLDSMLGQGSSREFKALSTRLERVRLGDFGRAAEPARKLAVQVIDQGASIKPRHKGVIRLVMACGLLAWVVGVMHPGEGLARLWHGRPRRASAARVIPAAQPTPFAPAAEAPEAAAPGDAEAVPVQESEGVAKLILPSEPTPQGTPVAALQGAAVALTRVDSRWYEVDEQGYVQPSAGPEAPSHLGLPLVAGPGLKAVVEHGRWVMRLKIGKEDLAGLFPLAPELAAGVQKILLANPSNPGLVTLDGTVVYLGAGNLHTKQEQLAVVLADLAAKGKKARLVDFRYDDSAVVRLMENGKRRGRRRLANQG